MLGIMVPVGVGWVCKILGNLGFPAAAIASNMGYWRNLGVLVPWLVRHVGWAHGTLGRSELKIKEPGPVFKVVFVVFKRPSRPQLKPF